MKFVLSKRTLRIKKRFALFPIRIGYEIRWFETVYIKQYRPNYKTSWVNGYFVTEEEYLKEIEKNRYIDVNE